MLLIVCLIVFSLPSFVPAAGDQADTAPEITAFAGQDLYVRGPEVTLFRPDQSKYILVFENRMSMSVGIYQFAADRGVVWIDTVTSEQAGTIYEVRCFLEKSISVDPPYAFNTKELNGRLALRGIEGMLLKEDTLTMRFHVSGEVFVTRNESETIDPRGSEQYLRAFGMMQTVGMAPTGVENEPYLGGITEKPIEPPMEKVEPVPTEKPVEQIEPELPEPPVEQVEPNEPVREVSPEEPNVPETPSEAPNEITVEPEEKEPEFRYPMNLSPISEDFKAEWDNKEQVGTVIGRFYISQKLDEEGGLLELQADMAVIFGSDQQPSVDKGRGQVEALLAFGSARSIYLAGDVVMTYERRTIRADEIYYDFRSWRGIATNVVMRTFDSSRGIPIYVRAARLRQVAENKLEFDDATITTSEFYVPQVSLNVAKATITDTTPVDERKGNLSKDSFDAQLEDVRLKSYDQTLFYWPSLRANLERPDLPIKGIRIGNDSTWGTSLETEWYLARLLGLHEPEGTDSTLKLDYFSKRGPAIGVETGYTGEDYFGRLLGYMINDDGKDRLGRINLRRNVEPPRDLRGRFIWQHRHFLPYNWQLTSEFSYLSDENFLESYYRNEFYVGKEQETLLHLKRIEDNWGLAFLGKVRVNDFLNQLDELPTAEFHWTGQSFLDDMLTFYSDSQASRLRQRYSSTGAIDGPEQFFSFATTRNEVDLPLNIGKTRVVPFVAGTVAYEDGFGFFRELDGGIDAREYDVWSAEGGVRVSSQPFWRVYPNVQSQLWDLNQMRHIIRPSLTAVAFTEGDSVFEQRDTLSAGISQRLQTKRGSGDNQRTIDWMRLDLDVTWVNNSGDDTAGADQFIWNKPLIPSINTYSWAIPLQDRRSSQIYGPRRNYIGADYIWRLSDTTAVLSDMNYDMQSGVVQQFNVGFSHLRWPDLQYYVGSRYLRRLDNGFGENGSNAFTFAVTYVLDPRYTVVFSQQVDFDYGKTVRGDITLIRRYHRLNWGLTFSTDESLDRQSITLSLWPEGISDLTIGQGRYTDLGGSAGY